MTSLPLVLVRSERERKSHFVRWSFWPLQLPLVYAAIKRSFLPSVYLDPHAGCRWRLDLSDSSHSMRFLGDGDGYNRFKRICLQRIRSFLVFFVLPFEIWSHRPTSSSRKAKSSKASLLSYKWNASPIGSVSYTNPLSTTNFALSSFQRIIRLTLIW